MKATQTKTQTNTQAAPQSARQAGKTAPFFKKGPGQGFFKPAGDGRQGDAGGRPGGNEYSEPESAETLLPVQTKLTIGAPDDPYEKEADQMADQVVRKAEKKEPASEEGMAPDKKAIRRKPIFESRNEPADEDVQRKSEGGNSSGGRAGNGSAAKTGGTAPASVAKGLAGSKGAGLSLPGSTRQEMEAAFGSDFSEVRVHHGSSAREMSRDLGAQAFTHGKDIYFNSGKYDPGSAAGKHLLAHELTHTVQQGGSKQSPKVQKDDDPAAKKDDTDIDTLYLPTLKQRNAGKVGNEVTYDPKYDRAKASADTAAGGETDQTVIWENAVKGTVPGMVDKLTEKAKTTASEGKSDGPTVFYLIQTHNEGDKPISLIGSKDTIVKNSLRPYWNKKGQATVYDVDHIKELQLGGANTIENMELLHFSANRSSGSLIASELRHLIELRKAAQQTEPDLYKFSKIAYNDDKIGFTRKAQGEDFWSLTDIQTGKHFEGFVPMTKDQIDKASGAKEPIIYTSEAGGKGFKPEDFNAFPRMSGAQYTPQSGGEKVEPGNRKGTLDIDILPPATETTRHLPIPVFAMEGVINGGNIPRASKGTGGLQKILSKLEIVGLSPADLDSVDIDSKKGLVVAGVIHPTLDIVKGIDLDFFIEGKDFGVSKTLIAEDIKAPSPFKVTQAFLTIGAGTKGIFVIGTAGFEIKGLGSGTITGKGASDGNFGIAGDFKFDKKLFKGDASVTVAYDNKNGWSVGGKLILSNEIKGIKEGSIDVSYANNELKATGTATTTIKGIKDVALRIKLGQDSSQIEGDVTIDKLPGIKEGSGSLKIDKTGDNYSFSGSGKITPDIPGLSTQIDFSFHDDIFTVDATLDYVNDRLSGKLKVGITNTDVDDDGNPSGKGKGKFTVYGGGSLTLKVTDSITATAGVKLLPNGEIEVKGGISLPARFEVVPTLLDIKDRDIIPFPTIHIPLFGIPLGVATIGLEATITPKLTASVQLGPGTLTNVGAEITYNPSHPDDMTVTGQADFEFIAEAGITAGVDFGIGVSAGIASITGGINLSAYIKAAAQQPVFHTDIKYSPKTGFELNGDVKAMVKAILGFSGKLFLQAEAGVSIFKVSKRWDKELFRKEIDTGLDIGFEFPFGYKDGKGNADFENLKFTYPKFDDNFMAKIKNQFITPVQQQLTGDIQTDEHVDQ